MNGYDYRIALTFTFDELKEQVLSRLSVREISECGPQAEGRHFIGDERQEDFVDAYLRLSAWSVCAALSGWQATTDFNAEEKLTVNLTVPAHYDEAQGMNLGRTIRDWICGDVYRRALQVMASDDKETERALHEVEMARQRAMMLLCAADTLRRVG